MKAGDIMTPNPSAVTPDETVAHAAILMRDMQVGCIPVVDDQLRRKLVGLITDRDIAVRCVAEGFGPSTLVRDHMTCTPLHVAVASTPVSEVVRRMETAQIRRIPVVSDGYQLLGIIAQADLATKLGPMQPLAVEEVLERISRRPLMIV